MTHPRTTSGLGIAAVLGLLGAAALGAVAVGWTAATTPLLMTLLEDTALYRLGMPAVAAEVAGSDVVARLNTGPLRLTREDVDRALRSHFGPEDVALKAREVHAGLVRFVRAYPRDSIFRVSIVRERPILVGPAERRVVRNYRSLPECGFATDLGVLGRAGRWKLFGDGPGTEFLETLPECRPPAPVADAVVRGVRAEFDRMLVVGEDSVDAFPDPATVDWPTFSRLVRRLQAADRFLASGAPVPLLGVVLLLAATAAAGRRVRFLPEGWPLVAALGAGHLVVGLGLRAGGLPELVLSAFGGEPGRGAEVQRLWLELGAYAVDRLLVFVSGGLLLAGAVLGLGGLLAVGLRYRVGRR